MINWYNKPIDAYPNDKDYEELTFIECGGFNNMNKKIFICTNVNKLKELGFKEESKNNYTYYNGITRGISVYEREKNYYISFIHYSHNVLSVFKKMIELKIIKEIEIPYYTRDTELNRLRKRIEELERKTGND